VIKIPKAFDACVKAGGRVRTKKLSGGRFIRICFKDGKSYAGEVKHSKTKEEEKKTKPEVKEEEEAINILENQDINITESLSFLEQESEDGKLFVEFTVAEAGVSNNGRRYFTKELESQKLTGLKLFMDHKYDARNAVGKITEQYMKGRKLMAKGWIKNSGIHPDIVEMVKDGRIDSVSLGGKGDIKRVKEKDRFIEEVHNLQIKEVSFVGMPGVSNAKIKKIGG